MNGTGVIGRLLLRNHREVTAGEYYRRPNLRSGMSQPYWVIVMDEVLLILYVKELRNGIGTGNAYVTVIRTRIPGRLQSVGVWSHDV